ncbi:MAG: hypothetical protein HY235_01915 [Acidobacteria bacterium]|nr:hypothetical protein [Acidobacteriota bacterium]
MVTRDILDGYLGESISEICPNGYTQASDNHCAHFVSHALRFRFGVTCRDMKKGAGFAACIRVQDVFHSCPAVGTWASKPASVDICLVFITHAANVDVSTRTMQNVPRKHVGIFFDGLVWHYSNSRSKVVNQTPTEFSGHYPAPSNSMFYGHIPWVGDFPTEVQTSMLA